MIKIDDSKFAGFIISAEQKTVQSIEVVCGINLVDELLVYLDNNGYINFTIEHPKENNGRYTDIRLISVKASRVVDVGEFELPIRRISEEGE